MSLLFNMLPRFVIAFLPRSKGPLISWLQSPSTVILEPKKIKSVTVSIVPPFICHELMGPDVMIFIFWMLSFKPAFPLSFTFIKRHFNSSTLSATRVVSSAYLKLLVFLLAIVIPVCASFSLAFQMMYSANRLNKQGDNIHPWCTPFPILSQSVLSGSNCCFLTGIQVSQEAGKVVWYSHIFKNFPQFVVTHTLKVFSSVNEAEIDVFLEFSCFFYDPMNVVSLISGSSAFSKSSLYIWKFSVHKLLKPSLKDFERYLANMWSEWNCAELLDIRYLSSASRLLMPTLSSFHEAPEGTVPTRNTWKWK